MSTKDYAALLSTYRTAILTTLGADGHLHARPMAMRQRVRGEEIWFATTIGSKKCKDLEHEPQCALTFAGEGEAPTISISGTGEVIRDRRLMRELWDASWARWFPAGPEAADAALIRVIPEHVERHGPGPGPGAVEVLFTAPRKARRAGA